ncbi:hypothetical protein OSO01_07200 [Oceanobacillus sojae]|uniref:Uncharacterized protein n=1 Tax=Oceanobacillus sojae TaxID=582851 RepID=A0A511ZEZ9_9BACI|nr:hypothetical protein OSO01_07200 [Oceanobacillus sojae]
MFIFFSVNIVDRIKQIVLIKSAYDVLNPILCKIPIGSESFLDDGRNGREKASVQIVEAIRKSMKYPNISKKFLVLFILSPV